MNRRGFLSLLGGSAAAITLDPERLLWTPGKRLISIPKPSGKIPILYQREWRQDLNHFIAFYCIQSEDRLLRSAVFVNPCPSWSGSFTEKHLLEAKAVEREAIAQVRKMAGRYWGGFHVPEGVPVCDFMTPRKGPVVIYA